MEFIFSLTDRCGRHKIQLAVFTKQEGFYMPVIDFHAHAFPDLLKTLTEN